MLILLDTKSSGNHSGITDPMELCPRCVSHVSQFGKCRRRIFCMTRRGTVASPLVSAALSDGQGERGTCSLVPTSYATMATVLHNHGPDYGKFHRPTTYCPHLFIKNEETQLTLLNKSAPL